jgi:hypothetical protein
LRVHAWGLVDVDLFPKSKSRFKIKE